MPLTTQHSVDSNALPPAGRARLRLRHRLRVATGLLLWGGDECLALWRSRRARQHDA